LGSTRCGGYNPARKRRAFELVDESIRQFEASGDIHLMPELLRVKGGILLSMQQPDREGAEECLKWSIELSRRQGARAWELRTATDLAALWASQGRADNAKALLQPVFENLWRDWIRKM
jgi:predicted ATPase